MSNKNDDRWRKLEVRLAKELPHIIAFFEQVAGFNIDNPGFKLSKDVKDVEWYTNSTIFINPSYMPKNERISYKAMLAHGYFHHVQYVLFKFYENEDIKNKISVDLAPEKLSDLINNFLESSAMFFAIVYITKGLSGRARTDKIMKYLKSKSYTPRKGKFYGGNGIILFAYSKNGYDIKKTLKQILSAHRSIHIMRNGCYKARLYAQVLSLPRLKK